MKLEQLFEMGAAKLCDKCGKTMAANHYWYKGGWKCKKAKSDDAPAKKDDDKKPEKKLKTAAELGLTGPGDGKERKMSDSMRAANEEAANKRAITFRAQLEKDRAAREAKEKAKKKS
jgi:hypothetical protein